MAMPDKQLALEVVRGVAEHAIAKNRIAIDGG
jgi:hypothetical protein